MVREQTVKQTGIGCLVILAAIPASWWLEAYTITRLWAWFVTPTMHVAAPSMTAALGLTVLASMFTTTPASTPPADRDETMAALVLRTCFPLLAKPALCLAFGWLWHAL